jgi:hypothetical protein
MHPVTRVALLGSTLLLAAACAKKEQPATDTAAVMAPAPAPAPMLSLADVAGKWQVRAVPESGTDTSATNYVLTATADTTGWMLTFPSKTTVPLQVRLDGDSVHVTSGAFSSQRRKNAKVSTESTFWMQDGKLVGRTSAHYVNAGADSVLVLHNEGTRIP